jgi:uncharacterized protein (TIGR02996 family)
MHEGFLQRICEQPGEDAHRLVYADFLDEHGDPDRAEFIRLQVRLARGVPAKEMPALRRREHELLVAHELEWTQPLHGIVQRARFVRGLVERVTLLAEGFVARGEELFRLAPIRHVILTDPEKQLRKVAGCPWLAGVETLEFRTLAGARIQDLLRSPHLGRLTALILRYGNVEDDGIEALAKCRALAGVTTLDLYGGVFEAAGMAALSRSGPLSSLTTLILNDNSYLHEDPGPILAGPHLRLSRLATLGLGFTQTGDAGAQALANEPRLASLRTLDLKYCQLSTTGAQALADSPHLQGLTLLDLRGNALSPAGRRRLVSRFGDRVKL